jgi:hypothetical protein
MFESRAVPGPGNAVPMRPGLEFDTRCPCLENLPTRPSTIFPRSETPVSERPRASRLRNPIPSFRNSGFGTTAGVDTQESHNLSILHLFRSPGVYACGMRAIHIFSFPPNPLKGVLLVCNNEDGIPRAKMTTHLHPRNLQPGTFPRSGLYQVSSKFFQNAFFKQFPLHIFHNRLSSRLKGNPKFLFKSGKGGVFTGSSGHSLKTDAVTSDSFIHRLLGVV